MAARRNEDDRTARRPRNPPCNHKFRNQRKTWLTQCIALTQNGQSSGSTNKRDVAYALDPEKKTYVFNITRATEPKMSLQILESINNGIVFSGKYESGTKIVANANGGNGQHIQRATRGAAKPGQVHDIETKNGNAAG